MHLNPTWVAITFSILLILLAQNLACIATENCTIKKWKLITSDEFAKKVEKLDGKPEVHCTVE